MTDHGALRENVQRLFTYCQTDHAEAESFARVWGRPIYDIDCKFTH